MTLQEVDCLGKRFRRPLWSLWYTLLRSGTVYNIENHESITLTREDMFAKDYIIEEKTINIKLSVFLPALENKIGTIRPGSPLMEFIDDLFK